MPIKLDRFCRRQTNLNKGLDIPLMPYFTIEFQSLKSPKEWNRTFRNKMCYICSGRRVKITRQNNLK